MLTTIIDIKSCLGELQTLFIQIAAKPFAPICSIGFESFLILNEAVLAGMVKHMRKTVLFGKPPRKLALDLPKLQLLVTLTAVIAKLLPLLCDQAREVPFLFELEVSETASLLDSMVSQDLRSFFESFPKMVHTFGFYLNNFAKVSFCCSTPSRPTWQPSF